MQLRKNNTGFTMLEVLITLVILSIGLLGLAGLQAIGLQNNHYAYMTTQAAQLAYDMGDRMRANMGSSLTGGVLGGSYNSLSPPAATFPLTKDCNSVSCTPAEMATYDFAYWNKDLADTLPSGQGTVSIAAGITTITVMWDEDRTGTTDTDCSATALKCFQVELEL